MLTRPVTERFYLRHTAHFQSPNRADSWGMLLHLSSQGRSWESPQFCHLLGPFGEQLPGSAQVLVYGTQELTAHS